MVPIARRYLFSDRLRFAISAGGVAFAVLLIVLMLALYQGIFDRAGRLAEAAPSNLWVSQAGVPDPFHGASILPAATFDGIRSVEGVEAVQPLLARSMQVGNSPNSGAFSFVMALPEGPLQVAAAEAFGIGALPERGQIVLSRVVADEVGAAPGDTVFIGTTAFKVVRVAALVEGGFSSTAAVSEEDAGPLFGHPEAFSYALVTVDAGADEGAVANAIEEGLAGTNALTPKEFADVTRQEVQDDFLPVIGVLVGVAFVVGLAVIAQTIYTSTVERARDYGVLKAVGASAGQLFSVVMRQSLIIGLTGYAVGTALAIGAGSMLEEAVPEFAMLYRWQDFAAVLGISLVMSGIAAVVPLRRLASIDPAAVFRA